MKAINRFFALIMCLVMVLSMFPAVHVHAAGGNVSMTVSSTKVEPGDEITVTVSNPEMTFQGLALFLSFDPTLVECTAMVNVDGDDGNFEEVYMYYYRPNGKLKDMYPMVVDDIEHINSDGMFQFAMMPGDDTTFAEGVIVELTFVALNAGTVTFQLKEECVGVDAYNGTTSYSVTIGSSEPEHECTPGAVSYQKGANGKHTKIVACDDNCGENYSVTEENCSGGNATCENAAVCEFCGNTYGEAKGHGKTNGFRYVHNNGTDTHDVICADCQKTVEEDVACTFENGSHVCKYECGNETGCVDGDNDHNCDVCGNELSKCSDKDNDGNHDCDVCGKPGITDCADGNNDHNCDDCRAELSKCGDKDNDGDHSCDICGKLGITKCADKTGDNDHNCDECGKTGITQCAGGTATCLKPAVCDECGKEYGQKNPQNHVGKQTTSYTDNGADHTVTVTCECGGEISSKNEPHNYGDDFTCDNCEHELAGWQQKGDAWYYVVDGKAVTGATRVPYPTAKINGVTYGPNAEDVAYANANTDSKYTDATTAVFIFGEDGKFQQTTGLVEGGKRYAVNGVIAWHVGLVEINGEYWYFIGDVNGGGNIAANGDTYLTRINGIAGFEAKEVYNFENGKFSGLNGLVDRYENGDLYYYENSKLMLGNGLTKLGEEYIYVRSNGQIVVGKQYWVAKTNKICDPGMYTFDENGFMQSAKDPTVNGLVDGIYYKNGMPYYAGLIEIDGDIYYINSAGEAVTGTYYITKIDNYTGSEYKRGDKLTFGTDGKLIIE